MNSVQQFYCQTEWGKVSYWLLDLNPPTKSETNTVKVILLLHGVGGSGRYWLSYLEWLNQIPTITHNTTRLIALAPDLLGFGLSDKPRLEYTAELQLKVIRATLLDSMRVLGLAETINLELAVVGHSMGGILAVLLAARLTQGGVVLATLSKTKLTGLVLLGTPFSTEGYNIVTPTLRSPFNRAMLSHPVVCYLVHHTFQLLWPIVLFLAARGIFRSGVSSEILTDYMRHTCQSFVSNTRQIVFGTYLEQVLIDLQNNKDLHTLLIYSQSDKEVPWEMGQALARSISNSNLILLDRVKHQALGQVAQDEVLKFILKID